MMFILTIATVNLAVGFGVAVYLRRIQDDSQTHWQLPTLPRLDFARSPAATASHTVAEVDSAETHPTAMPPEWLDVLEGAEVSSHFVEATVQVFRLEIGRYREQLMRIDRRLRASLADPDAEAIESCLAELRQLNHEHLEHQAAATRNLTLHDDELGELAAIGRALEQELIDKAKQIEATAASIEAIDLATDPPAGTRGLIVEIGKLLDRCHALRDTMLDALLAIAKSEGNLAHVDERLLTDPVTALRSRAGLERDFEDWWHNDPARLRSLSIAMFDLDNFRRINDDHGPEFGDRVLRAFGQFVDDLMRKNRGVDIAGRLEGQCFIMFYGDTGPRGAICAIERMRQALEKSTFECGETRLKLTFSAGVTDVRQKDCTTTLLRRARKTLSAAKKDGRNRTYADDGNGPQPVEPPDYNLEGHVRLI